MMSSKLLERYSSITQQLTIIELKKFTISSFKRMKILSYKYKFEQIFKKICQVKL